MNKDQKFLYWLDISEYDLKTAEAMLTSGRFVYVVFKEAEAEINRIIIANQQNGDIFLAFY